MLHQLEESWIGWFISLYGLRRAALPFIRVSELGTAFGGYEGSRQTGDQVP